MKTVEVDHPLIRHKLGKLRDIGTDPVHFRQLAGEVAAMLAYEATRDMPLETRTVQTWAGPLEVAHVRSEQVTLVPILRAGLGMVQPFVDLFPDVSVGYIGLERDHETARARSYYHKLPPMAGARTLIVDPMLATGGSASQAIDLVIQAGAIAPRLICIVASPEGVEAVRKTHPDTHVYVAAVDRALDARKYILPGLGDFGDRLYGT